jgi:hypothetical protein
METAQEFIERYLNEKASLNGLLYRTGAPFYQKYFMNAYFKHYSDFRAKREANPEMFESIEINDQTARVITSERFDSRLIRSRYNLSVSDGQWKISSKESECFICHGSGHRGEQECHVCEGKGWKNYAQTAT